MKNAPVKVVTALFIFAIACHGAATNAKSAMEAASKAGQFLCLTFYESPDASFTAMSSSVTSFKKSSGSKVATFNAKISDPTNYDVVNQNGIQGGDLPVLLVIAPNGVITGGYPKSVTMEQLKQSVSVSDLMLKTLKPLQEQKVALVALQNQATKLNQESWQGVNEFANDQQFKQFVSAMKADPAAAGSQEFLKQCGLKSPLTEATVIVLLPPGRIGKVIVGKTTKDDILKCLQSCSAGSCKPGACSDRRFKHDITPIDSALDKVSRLQGVRFTWNRAAFPDRDFPESGEVGLVAQDVESVVPEVVHTDLLGYKSLSYDKLTALLIEAVKELNGRIQVQDSIIKAQNARLEALETRQ